MLLEAIVNIYKFRACQEFETIKQLHSQTMADKAMVQERIF
jgi:hypothetical protein